MGAASDRASKDESRLSHRIRQAEEKERRRIALHLHDHVGQNLVIAKMKIATLRSESRPEEIGKELDALDELLKETIAATRQLTVDLASPVVYELGLEAALESLCDHARQQSPTQFRFEPDKRLGPIPKSLAVAFYRMARELVHNVIKHAGARTAVILLNRTGRHLRLGVRDDGLGFDTSAVRGDKIARSGIGLLSVEERVGHFGGRMDLVSTPGRGTHVTLSVPMIRGEERPS